ncbi:MAG: DUF1501 domain-containing protein [Archangiaceae bacterium]|nr:DUF1501 domain-containing protein [Archangiaceae bacterium]
MKRRAFLQGAGAGGAISVLDWLGWFERYGVPGTAKSLGLASAAAQVVAEPKYLIYWFQEGGWDSYCMFGAVDTPNNSTLTVPAGTLHPVPEWSQQFYRPKGYPSATQSLKKVQGNIEYGYLAADGMSLFPDMAVVASHQGNAFHSGSRLEYHYGKYASYYAPSALRGAQERTVLQAFCEAYGSSVPLPHVSWHRWLSDGELSEATYTEGKGYYEKLGPAYAHTVYGQTPADMRARLASVGGVTSGAKGVRIRQFVDKLHDNFLSGKDGESVRAFASAVQIHRQLSGATGITVNPATMFTDATLRAEFGVAATDEQTTSTVVNSMPARSKNSPNTNVQAMMTYELMRAGLSIGFWIENRQIRGFDSHRSRSSIKSNQGQTDQLATMRANLWTPLKALVSRLKSTASPVQGKSLFDLTTIVVCSEMGRTLSGDVQAILMDNTKYPTDTDKYNEIMAQDCCQHWEVSSCAFLGGTVRGDRQWGRVGSSSLKGIPLMPDGTLDPAYDPITGALIAGRTKNASSFVSDAGHVYATALHLTGLDGAALLAAGKGKNVRAPMKFIKK